MKWLVLFLVLATVVSAAIIYTNKAVEQRQRTIDKQLNEIKQEAKQQSQQQKLEIEQKIKELEAKLQAKKDAQEAQKRSLAQRVVDTIVPAAQASEVPQNASDNYSLVTKWANHYGIDPSWLHRVVKCESGYRSDAVNGSYWAGGSTPTGIAQFLADTYIANARRIGLPAQDDRLNPDRSLQVMAYMFSIGQWTQWACR